MSPSKREQRRADWEASGAPQVQARLRAALVAVGVDLSDYAALVGTTNRPGEFRTTIMLSGADLDALIAALERAAAGGEPE